MAISPLQELVPAMLASGISAGKLEMFAVCGNVCSLWGLHVSD